MHSGACIECFALFITLFHTRQKHYNLYCIHSSSHPANIMEEKKLFTLKLIGFDPAATKNLDAVLTLAERGLNAKWRGVETENPDFFLLSPKASKSADSDPILQKLPREQCLFCISADSDNLPHDNTLMVDEKGIPGLRALVELFNQLIIHPPETTISPSAKTPATEITDDSLEFFDFEQGFLGFLLNTKNETFTISLTDKPDYAPIYVNDLENSYYSRHDLLQLEHYVTATDKLDIRPCSRDELKNHVESEKLRSQPLKDLIWYAAIKTSAGKVIRGYSPSDIVTLKKWPDLRLPGCLGYAKLTTFMKNNATTLQTVSELTKIPLDEIYPFYNACYLIGLIELKLEEKLNKRNIAPERLELLNQIGARLEQ